MSYVQDDPNTIDHELAYTPELVGAECCSCWRILRHRYFERDSSSKTGYKSMCIECSQQPRLSMEEHTARLRQSNFNSEGVKRQRHEDQDEFRKRDPRSGKPIHCSDFLLKIHRLVPSLFVKEGGIVNDLALYQVAETPQVKWGGKNYSYLGWVTYTLLPEYSLYEFDEERDVMIRASDIGWRDVLLRFVREGLLTEEQCNKEFGSATGEASTVWFKKLWNLRNNKQIPENGN